MLPTRSMIDPGQILPGGESRVQRPGTGPPNVSRSAPFEWKSSPTLRGSDSAASSRGAYTEAPELRQGSSLDKVYVGLGRGSAKGRLFGCADGYRVRLLVEGFTLPRRRIPASGFCRIYNRLANAVGVRQCLCQIHRAILSARE
jgi:hypothetical protein